MAINAATKLQERAVSSVDHLVDCMNRVTHGTHPYDHWLLDDVLPESVIDDVLDLPFTPPQIGVFGGSRESNNATRVYFNEANQEKYSVCREVVDTFRAPAVIETLQRVTGANLSKTLLRIEHCQDANGFWLEPHPDISVKRFSMLLYLSDDPRLEDAGTDMYGPAPEFKWEGRAEYGKNKGMIFVPAANTMHGYSRRPINGIRKSLMINYVTQDWRNVHELTSLQTVAD